MKTEKKRIEGQQPLNNFQIPNTPSTPFAATNTIDTNSPELPLDENLSLSTPQQTYIQNFNNNFFEITMNQCNNKFIPRKETFNIQKDISNILITPIQKELQSIFQQQKDGNIENATRGLEKLICTLSNPFENICSKYKLIKTLIEIDLYKHPSVIQVDSTVRPLLFHHINTLNVKVSKGVIFPIKFQIRKFFEAPGNNALGSHCTSILACYFSFPTAPVHLKHKLSNIFIAALYKSKDIKTFGNDRCLFRLINILNDLEINGIEIKIGNRCERIYFALGLVLGDNLALNCVLGFARSFSAIYCCRFCNCSKQEIWCGFEESFANLRNKTNYEEELNSTEVLRKGVRENSIFNSMTHFHVLENYSVDLLHDILEGVLKYDLAHIIIHYINSNVFDLEFLNMRNNNFDYGETEIGNSSQPILMNHLKNFNLKMSGREMLTFAHFFLFWLVMLLIGMILYGSL